MDAKEHRQEEIAFPPRLSAFICGDFLMPNSGSWRAPWLMVRCICSQFMVCAAVRQKQLAKFRMAKIFLSLELPRSRQRIACFHASNLARVREVDIQQRCNFVGRDARGREGP
jgi:hypothetical protein